MKYGFHDRANGEVTEVESKRPAPRPGPVRGRGYETAQVAVRPHLHHHDHQQYLRALKSTLSDSLHHDSTLR